MHTKYIIISEDLAREGVERFINGMVRSRQIRRIAHIIIVKGKASKFVEEFKPLLTSAISKAGSDIFAPLDYYYNYIYFHFVLHYCEHLLQIIQIAGCEACGCSDGGACCFRCNYSEGFFQRSFSICRGNKDLRQYYIFYHARNGAYRCSNT